LVKNCTDYFLEIRLSAYIFKEIDFLSFPYLTWRGLLMRDYYTKGSDYVIVVNRMEVEVKKSVFDSYAEYAELERKNDRRYHDRNISLESSMCSAVIYDYKAAQSKKSLEDEVLDRIEVESLTKSLREIDSLILKMCASGYTETEIGAEINVTQQAVHSRKKHIREEIMKEL
jgi:hypothetical protein